MIYSDYHAVLIEFGECDDSLSYHGTRAEECNLSRGWCGVMMVDMLDHSGADGMLSWQPLPVEEALRVHV